jgi:hypothetical protein
LLALLAACGTAGGAERSQSVAVSPAAPSPAAQPPVALTPTSTPTPAVRTGAFDARPGEDTVSGAAALSRAPDERLSLQLTNLNATPGPALFVYLSHVESPTSDGQVKDGVEVAALKSPKGDQLYTVDSGADPAEFRSVVVYCRQYRVIFGYANLK